MSTAALSPGDIDDDTVRPSELANHVGRALAREFPNTLHYLTDDGDVFVEPDDPSRLSKVAAGLESRGLQAEVRDEGDIRVTGVSTFMFVRRLYDEFGDAHEFDFEKLDRGILKLVFEDSFVGPGAFKLARRYGLKQRTADFDDHTIEFRPKD